MRLRREPVPAAASTRARPQDAGPIRRHVIGIAARRARPLDRQHRHAGVVVVHDVPVGGPSVCVILPTFALLMSLTGLAKFGRLNRLKQSARNHTRIGFIPLRTSSLVTATSTFCKPGPWY